MQGRPTHYSCHILMKLEFSRQIFGEHSNIKFHENPSSGSRDVQYGRTDGQTDRQTDMTKLIITFCNFADAPKKESPMFDICYIFQFELITKS
jgi:hypothetical protein